MKVLSSIPTALTALTALAALAGCARAQSPDTAAAPADSAEATSRRAAEPAHYGTLDQNAISIRMRDDDIELRFVPLDPRVTSLLVEDGARALQQLVERSRTAIDSAGREHGVSTPGLALVTFFGLRDGVRFDPQLLTVESSGRLLRPMAAVPLSASFGAGQLAALQSATAIYLYDEPLPVLEPFSVTYGLMTSSAWRDRLPILDRERARVNRSR